MALKYNLDSLEGLEESLHAVYREEGGKYVLDAEGVKPLADFDKINNALLAERKVSKQFKDVASAWESRFQGKSPDELAAALERIPLLEAESQGKVDATKHATVVEQTVKQRMATLELEITKLKQAVTEREQSIASYQAADKRRTIHDAVRVLAAKEGFQESSYASAEGALMLLAERHFTINGAGDVVVSDESKAYTPGLGLREALGEVKNQHGYLLKQSVGGGASGSSFNGSGTNPFKTNNLTARGEFIKNNSIDKVNAAVKAAGLDHPSQLHTEKR